MYSYVTMNDIGCGPEGKDAEVEGLSYIFDDPGSEQVVFDPEPAGRFAFDGLGQIIAEEQLERLGLERLGDVGGLGAGATTLNRNEQQLPPPPAGEQWVYKGPNVTGTGHDWESVPIEAAPAESEDTSLMDKIKENKVVVGISATAILAGFWWFFLRGKGGE
jgi:hypothetical protein